MLITNARRKNLVKDDRKKAQSKSPPRKLQKTHESSERNMHDLSSSSESDEIKDSNEDDSKNLNVNTEADKDTTVVTTKLNKNDPSNSVRINADKNLPASNFDSQQKIIKELFLVEMPKDFYQFYEFCKSISKDNPLLACKSVCLKLVGPYDVLGDKIKDLVNEEDKEKYLTHWRYYYDPPEFQVCVICIKV